MKKGTSLPLRAAPVLIAGLLLGTALTLTGCGSGAKSSDAATAVETTAASAWDINHGIAVEETAAAVEMDAAAPAAAAEKGSALTSKSEVTNPAAPGRKLIRNMDLTVETDTFDTLLTNLQAKIAELSGYVEQSEISGSSIEYGNRPSSRDAAIIARVPSDRLDQFVDVISEQANVTYKSENTSDVTLKYSDLESRKKTLSVEQDRIWALLEKADTLEAVIALEERLSEIRYELESMESKLRLMDNQVEYSTVRLNIREVRTFTPTEPESTGSRIKKGFAKNLESIQTLITETFIVILAGSPVWAPIAVVILIVLFVIRRRSKGSGNREPYKETHNIRLPGTDKDMDKDTK